MTIVGEKLDTSYNLETIQILFMACKYTTTHKKGAVNFVHKVIKTSL